MAKVQSKHICKICGKLFDCIYPNQVYCSLTCKQVYNARKAREHKIKKRNEIEKIIATNITNLQKIAILEAKIAQLHDKIATLENNANEVDTPKIEDLQETICKLVKNNKSFVSRHLQQQMTIKRLEKENEKLKAKIFAVQQNRDSNPYEF